MRGIDVSSWQGKIDWDKACRGLDFVILRAHQLYGEDDCFQRNYGEAVKHDLPVGAYKLSYAVNEDDAREEVKKLLKTLSGKRMDFPVFLDLEDAGGQQYLSIYTVEKIIETYRIGIEEAGYRFGIYCNLDWYRNHIPDSAKGYSFWLASYPYEDDGSLQERLRPDEPHTIGWQYSQNGRIDGIEGGVDMDEWNEKVAITNVPPRGINAGDVINVMRGWLGNAHETIVSIYNAHKPLAQGYRLTMDDAWCDATVSSAFIVLRAEDMIGGTECGVERHVKLFQKKGIWNEDGSVTPVPGDIIVFNWDDDTQPNDGFSDHIGIVESVNGGIIHTIEGNSGGLVARRTYQVGEGCIRGYARPHYDEETWEPSDEPFSDPAEQAEETELDKVVSDVIAGKWGNGKIRERLLSEAGYNYKVIQAEVNRRLK